MERRKLEGRELLKEKAREERPTNGKEKARVEGAADRKEITRFKELLVDGKEEARLEGRLMER